MCVCVDACLTLTAVHGKHTVRHDAGGGVGGSVGNDGDALIGGGLGKVSSQTTQRV